MRQTYVAFVARRCAVGLRDDKESFTPNQTGRRTSAGAYLLGMSSFFVALTGHDELVVREKLIAAFHAVGAESPQTAKTIVEIDVEPDDVWDSLVRKGTIREAAPGTFYLYEVKRPSRRERVLKIAFFYSLILLIPIIMILLAGRPR